jgi:hypothetical protein
METSMKDNRFLKLTSMAKLLSNNKSGTKYSFLVDNGLAYCLRKDKYNSSRIVSVYDLDMHLLDGKCNNHYIKTEKGYVKTGLTEYEELANNDYIVAKDYRTKKYIVTLNTTLKHVITRVQVYSRKTGTLLLDLSREAKEKDSEIAKEIVFVEKDKIIQEIISNTRDHSVIVNTYKVCDNSVKKRTRKFRFPEKVSVLVSGKQKKTYIIFKDKSNHNVQLHILDGMDFKRMVLPEVNGKGLWGNNCLNETDLVILKMYNPDRKQLEYFVRDMNSCYMSKDFPSEIVQEDVKFFIKYKNYTIVARSKADYMPVTVTLYHFNKKILSFTEDGQEYVGTLMYKKGKYIYIAVAHRDGIKLSKYATTRDDQLCLVNTSFFKLPDNRTADSLYKLLKGKVNYKKAVPVNIMRNKEYYDFVSSFQQDRVIPFSYMDLAFDEDDRQNELIPYTLHKQYYDDYGLKVYNDNVVEMNTMIFLKDKHNNVFFTYDYKVCCDKAAFAVVINDAGKQERVFLYDFEKKDVQYLDCGTRSSKKTNLLTEPSNRSSYVHIVVADKEQESDWEIPASGSRIYSLDMSKKNPAPSLLFSTTNISNIDRIVFLYNYWQFNEKQLLFYTFLPFQVEAYVQGKRIFNTADSIAFNSFKDVKAVLKQTRQLVKIREEIER